MLVTMLVGMQVSISEMQVPAQVDKQESTFEEVAALAKAGWMAAPE